MAVVSNRVTLPPDTWVDLTPDIFSAEASFINTSDAEAQGHHERMVEVRIQEAEPGASDRGDPYMIGHGFIKRTLSELSFASGTLHVWARVEGVFAGEAQTSFIDTN